MMQFHASYVSTAVSVGGDYYQATFEVDENIEELDSATPYLMIQRDFEESCDDSCYIETHDKSYCGHFVLQRIEFTPERLAIVLARPTENLICVTYRLTEAEFQDALRVMKIISGETEPEPE